MYPYLHPQKIKEKYHIFPDANSHADKRNLSLTVDLFTLGKGASSPHTQSDTPATARKMLIKSNWDGSDIFFYLKIHYSDFSKLNSFGFTNRCYINDAAKFSIR